MRTWRECEISIKTTKGRRVSVASFQKVLPDKKHFNKVNDCTLNQKGDGVMRTGFINLKWEGVKKYIPSLCLTIGGRILLDESILEIHEDTIIFEKADVKNGFLEKHEYAELPEHRQIKGCVEVLVNNFMDELLIPNLILQKDMNNVTDGILGSIDRVMREDAENESLGYYNDGWMVFAVRSYPTRDVEWYKVVFFVDDAFGTIAGRCGEDIETGFSSSDLKTCENYANDMQMAMSGSNALDNLTKGELMDIAFSKDELLNIDPSLPLGWDTDSLPEYVGQDSYWFVMDYNDDTLGRIRDMRKFQDVQKYLVSQASQRVTSMQ
mgnify:CR=1 FL=1